MSDVRPFRAIRPNTETAAKVAALPYDVYNREEAKTAIQNKPLSFLNIDRPETQFSETQDMYAAEVYKKAHDLLYQQIEEGVFVKEAKPCYYLYELTMNGRAQTGIVACASIDDYVNGVIMKHENTREEKEQDRIRHVTACDAQTGPIFLAYRSNAVLKKIMDDTMQKNPLYDFVSEDGIRHRVFLIDGEDTISAMQQEFQKIQQIYIADGHHRAASAVKVGLMKRKEHPEASSNAEFNYFLSVLFPEDQLMIMPYNRVVKDLNGYTAEAFIEELKKRFTVEVSKERVFPQRKGTFGMYLEDAWYLLSLNETQPDTDPVASLDVSVLQNLVLAPILQIEDPRVDKRIDFIGGIRGLEELERRVHTDMKVAFSMYPTTISELFAVSDAKMLMPPKSTWFEPKLRSGLFIHALS